jgi:sulfur-carrier protein
MPRVRFTANLSNQTAAPECRVSGGTVTEALGQVFAQHPALRSYVLDDQGSLRKHVAIFLDGECVRDRVSLTDVVRAESEIFVMQSLSGG